MFKINSTMDLPVPRKKSKVPTEEKYRTLRIRIRMIAKNFTFVEMECSHRKDLVQLGQFTMTRLSRVINLKTYLDGKFYLHFFFNVTVTCVVFSENYYGDVKSKKF